MEIKVREVEKVLEFIALNGYDAVTKANEGIDSIKKWQQVSIDEIHQFASVIKRIEEPAVRKMLKSELHSRKLLYKNSLRAMMKRRRFYKAVKDFFSWQQYTYNMQARCLPSYVELGDRYSSFGWFTDRERTWNDIADHLMPSFIITTPFKLCGRSMQFYGNKQASWMSDALTATMRKMVRHGEYELHSVKVVSNSANKKDGE